MDIASFIAHISVLTAQMKWKKSKLDAFSFILEWALKEGREKERKGRKYRSNIPAILRKLIGNGGTYYINLRSSSTVKYHEMYILSTLNDTYLPKIKEKSNPISQFHVHHRL